MTDQSERLARAWDEAADGYETYFVPRFAPWVRAAVDAVAFADLPDGPILVPCCGTFPELPALLAAFPDRRIAGLDLSAGMIRIARERAEGRANVELVVGDAADLDARWSGACAAVVSVFGLQQLPDPEHAIRAWAGALRKGGVLSVVYWPDETEEEGPFATARAVLRERVGTDGDDASWEPRLVPALAGRATVTRDEDVAYPMVHADAAAYFDALTDSGPGRAMRNGYGEEFVAELRAEYLRRAPAGEWRHEPHARHIVARIP